MIYALLKCTKKNNRNRHFFDLSGVPKHDSNPFSLNSNINDCTAVRNCFILISENVIKAYIASM